MDKQVDEYIKKQKSPQKEIIKKVREIFLKTLPGCEEKSVWGGSLHLRPVSFILLQ